MAAVLSDDTLTLTAQKSTASAEAQVLFSVLVCLNILLELPEQDSSFHPSRVQALPQWQFNLRLSRWTFKLLQVTALALRSHGATASGSASLSGTGTVDITGTAAARNLNQLGFTALPWAPLGWRQLQTYQDVFC
jgi:hypothetical protein